MSTKYNEKIDVIKEKVLEAIKFSGIAFLISFLGAIAGSEGASKDWRRIGIPIVFLIASLISLKLNLYSFFIILQHFVLRLGWGVPSIVPGYEDEGSAIGAFYYKLFNKNLTLANIFTRGTIASLLCLTFLYLPLIKNNWMVYTSCSIGIILSFALLAWREFGTYEFKIKGKIYYCCKSDVIVFGILGLLGMKIIF
jgi:hypothetical protein